MAVSRSDQDLEALLNYLKRNRGFDFTGYKRASLARRIEKRLQTVNMPGYAEYLDYLEVHPEEFAQLFNTILINVTSFFRDEGSWEFLAGEVLPDLITRKGTNDPIRVWSAGCASGEEAYTLAILLCEALGVDAFRERAKIYATDLDEEALAKARHATYSEREVDDVPASVRRKYFEVVDGQYVFRKDLRRQVIFGRHDLINDAPISRVDLLVCRNTLMYLNSETQAKILAGFHFALTDGGILFLGRAETLLTHASTFQPIDLKRRISAKVPRGNLNLRDRLLLMAQNGTDDPTNGMTQHIRLREVALDATPVAQLLIDSNGQLALANERARSMFSIGANDIGRALQDLKISYRPVELRSLLEQAALERRPVLVRDVEWQLSLGDARYLDLQVVPLYDGTYLGASVTFLDVTSSKRLQRELETARQDLETAYEELQSTNEELQSTNEELETMNEELQSTNEELQTINDELRQRSDELNQVNAFLESVLASIRGAVVVLDTELRVLVWNQRSQDLWGLREDETVGKHFLGLDIGLPVAALKQPIRASLSGNKETTRLDLTATNRRGKPLTCSVTISPLKGGEDGARGVIMVMEEADGAGAPERARGRNDR